MHAALLLVLAVSEDPAVALEQLARYGEAPECRREESIEQAGSDHVHHFAPPKVLPRLEGQYAVLLPYLEHSSRKVVLRAVSLMCHTGHPQAPAQVLAVARRFPCERELVSSAAALAGAEVSSKGCPTNAAPAWQAPARTLAGWKKPSQAERAKAIAAGDARQLQHTLWDLDALDPARVEDAAATLAQLDAPAAFLPTATALRQALGPQFARTLEALWRGILGVQLANIGKKLKVDLPAAFCAVAGLGSAEDYELLQQLRGQQALAAGKDALPQAAEAARRAKELTPFGREYLEDLAAADSPWRNEAVEKMIDYRDRPSLRAFVKDGSHRLRDRLEAARGLATLGDASGLTLFESPTGLWPSAYQQRRELLARLSSESPAPVRAQADALLARSWPNRR